MNRSARFRSSLFLSSTCAIVLLMAGCISHTSSPDTSDHQAVVFGPGEGTELWFDPSSADNLGKGSHIRIHVDHLTVPYATMTVMTQRLGESGIPTHLHKFEDEILYVLSGKGSAIVGEERAEIPIEPGSTIYVPQGEWHGVLNADPGARVEVLIVTTPSTKGGLADFFRKASVQPGHPPLNLPPEEFLALFDQYGMSVPDQ